MDNKRIMSIGSTVVVRTATTTRTLTIVHEPGDLARLTISTSSPLGRSLLGHAAHESVAVETPSGRRMYEIVDVL